MKNKNLTLLSFSIVALTLSTSCKKWGNHEQPNPVGKAEIKKIVYTPSSPDLSLLGTTLLFNPKGEPYKAVPAGGGSTENPYSAFQYDAKGRLRYWIQYFDFFSTGEPSPIGGPAISSNLFVYHAYSSDPKGNIATDTVYYAGTQPYLLQSVTTYQYDAQKRLISSSYVFYDQGTTPKPAELTTYTYDGAGNLVGYAFDNKPSLKSTSKTIQFLTKDYSVNNRLQSSFGQPITYQYNALGLPIRMEGGTLFPLTSGSEGITLITY